MASQRAFSYCSGVRKSGSQYARHEKLWHARHSSSLSHFFLPRHHVCTARIQPCEHLNVWVAVAVEELRHARYSSSLSRVNVPRLYACTHQRERCERLQVWVAIGLPRGAVACPVLQLALPVHLAMATRLQCALRTL